METFSFRTLLVALLATWVRGADHDVMQVKSPHVVKHPLGPSMEVHQQQPTDLSTTFREMRNANFPSPGRECYSCTTGTFGSSDFSSRSHSAGGSYGAGDAGGIPSYGVPLSTSSRQEVRREQKFVNGQPVYNLHHERKFQDGRLVHEEKSEKDGDDFGASYGPALPTGIQTSEYDWQSGAGYSKGWEESRHGSEHSLGSIGSDGYPSDFNAEMARLQEQMHRQVGTYGSQPILPSAGGSHRTEFHTQTRYVNGQPIYVKKEERKYEDGRLVHNATEEKGAEDLGTADLQRQYDSSGAFVGGGAAGGSYESRQQYEESHRRGGSWYPSSSYHGSDHRSGLDASESQYGSHIPASSISSASSASTQSGYSGYRPTYGSSTQYGQEHLSSDAHQSRDGSFISSYPSHREADTPKARGHSPTYPAYRPYSEKSSTYGRQDSRSSSSYRPSQEVSSVRYGQESTDYGSSYPASKPISVGSSSEHTRNSLEKASTYSSHQSAPYRPTHGSSSDTYRGETRDRVPSSYPSYRPVSSGSSSQTSEETYQASSSYPSYRPSSGSSSTRISDESHRASSPTPSPGRYPSSYPSYRPSSGSSSTRISDESHRAPSPTPSPGRYPSSYPSYRPSSGSSSSRVSEESHRASSLTPSPGRYPSYRPSEGGSSTTYSEERRTSSSHSSDDRRAQAHNTSPSGDLEATRVLQSVSGSSLGSDDSYATQINMNAINQEPARDYDQYYRPTGSDSSHRARGSHTVTTEERYRGQDFGSHRPSYPSSVAKADGGARTVAIDLSSSSSSDTSSRDQSLSYGQSAHDRDQLSTYGRGAYSSTHEEGRLSSHSRGQSSISPQPSPGTEHGQVGIPGVLSGPQSSHGDGDYYDKERYDISPLDDELPQLPAVDNEIDSSLIPALPDVGGEVDSSHLYQSHTNESYEQHHGRPDGSPITDYDHGYNSSSAGHSDRASEYSHSSYRYNTTHTIYGTPIAQPASTVDRSQQDYSHSSSVDESQRTYPATAGSSHYRYNETRRHSTVVGGQQSPAVSGSSLTSDCSQVGGCGVGSSHTSSRRSEIRISKRYINGQLVGITHYERLYENGKLVHENVTEQGINELTPEQLQSYGIDQLSLEHDSYQPESYSQRHEVRQEKKYVDGQQTYDLHHEKRFEDGQLVHDNRTEKDEDDFEAPSLAVNHLGIGHASGGQVGGAGRHEIMQSQHLQQHVTTDSRPGSVGRSSQTHEVSDTSRVLTNPVYTTHRQETRRQQEYINGQPVYDLHHERRFQDGSLVYENRTELDEKEAKESSGGHYDALHQIMSGSTLNTASESTYSRPSGASGSGSYDSYSGGSHVGSLSSSLAARESSSAYGSSGSSLLSGESSMTHGGGARTTILGGSLGHGSSGRDSSSSGSSLLSGESSMTHSGGARTTILGGSLGHGSSSRESSSSGSSLLSGESSMSHSGGARTTILGGSLGHGSSGREYSSSGSSLPSGESSMTHSGGARTTILGGSLGHESSGRESSSSGSSLLSGESSMTHSGGARTTILGGSLGRGSSSRQSSSSSSFETSQSASGTNPGCLTCVLIGGSGYSSDGSSSSHAASHGSSTSLGGAGVSDGYSQRRESAREEYYEDGQLVRGQEEDREFRDGQLIQENTRQYSGVPGQFPSAEALQSAGTSYTSGSSSSSSSSSTSSHTSSASSGKAGRTGLGARVTVKGDTTGDCDPNPCMSGGTCIAGLRGPLCVCTFGFKGTRCEEVYCPRRFCRYGGTCSVVDGMQECACKSGFSGPRCETRRRG